MDTLQTTGPFGIVRSEPIGGSPVHDVRITLDDGRIIVLCEADYGYREYPHPGYNVMLVAYGTPRVMTAARS